MDRKARRKDRKRPDAAPQTQPQLKQPLLQWRGEDPEEETCKLQLK